MMYNNIIVKQLNSIKGVLWLATQFTSKQHEGFAPKNIIIIAGIKLIKIIFFSYIINMHHWPPPLWWIDIKYRQNLLGKNGGTLWHQTYLD